MRILKQSDSAKKTRKGEPSGLFETSVCCKRSKTLKGDLETKMFEKSRTVQKKYQKGGGTNSPAGFVS